MTNMLVFLSSSVAAVIGVAFALGLAWVTLAISLLVSAAAGYGLVRLGRRGRSPRTRSGSSRQIRA
jgi:UPF0716 family protein affecting phage T7 exclusion